MVLNNSLRMLYKKIEEINNTGKKLGDTQERGKGTNLIAPLYQGHT